MFVLGFARKIGRTNAHMSMVFFIRQNKETFFVNTHVLTAEDCFAAELYGVPVKATGIQDLTSNMTRFVIFKKKSSSIPETLPTGGVKRLGGAEFVLECFSMNCGSISAVQSLCVYAYMLGFGCVCEVCSSMYCSSATYEANDRNVKAGDDKTMLVLCMADRVGALHDVLHAFQVLHLGVGVRTCVCASKEAG